METLLRFLGAIRLLQEASMDEEVWKIFWLVEGASP